MLKRKRQGFTLLEAMAAAAMLAVAATIVLETLLLGAAAGRDANRRRLAAREAANRMEQVMALPDDAFNAQGLGAVKLSDDAAKTLNGAKLDIRIDEEPADGLPSQRVTVTLSWQDGAGQTAHPLKLVAWRHGQLAAPADASNASKEDKP